MKAVKDLKGKRAARDDDDESFVALEVNTPRHVEIRIPRRTPRGWYSSLPRHSKDRLLWTLAFVAFVLAACIIGLAVGLLAPSNDLIGGYDPVAKRETMGKSKMGSALGESPKWSRWGARGGGNGYDALVALGGGNSDSGHKRHQRYWSSLRPAPYWQGRWTNGRVAFETLSSTLSPTRGQATFVDYAYGGSGLNNSVTARTSPDLIQQSSAMASDVADGSLGSHVKNGKLLIAIWPPTGTVTDVSAWKRTMAGESVDVAKSDLTTAADTILTTAATLSFSFAFASPPDLLILPLPPALSLPFNRVLARSNATALRTLSDLDDHFDSQLNATVSALSSSAASNSSSPSGEQQIVYTFPIRDWFDEMVASPGANNLTSSTSPCFDGKAVCRDPAGFAFWDWVHWSSTMHDRLALALSRMITGA